MIIDIHTHGIFDYNKDTRFIDRLLKLMDSNRISLAGTTLNTNSKGLKEDIFLELSKGFKKDPYKKYNLKMINSIYFRKMESRIIPFFYLPPKKKIALVSAKFYEQKFKNKLFGYKVHNQELRTDLDDLIGFTSRRPIIIHPSVDKCANPKKILKFSEMYEGNVDVAHFGKFNITLLKKVKTQKNLFIDSCIGIKMFHALKNNSKRVYHPKELQNIKSLKELYERISIICGKNKVLFATDYPLCNKLGEGYEKEVRILNKIKKELFLQIAYKNAKEFLEIK
jgi:hypothetical protein